MARAVPPTVATIAEELDLGGSVGSFPRSTNLPIILMSGICAVPFACSGIAGGVGGLSSGSSTPVIVAIACFAVAAGLVALAVTVRRSRVFYLYRGGIIATNWRGRVYLSASWEDLYLVWRRLSRSGVVTDVRDHYELLVDGSVMFRHAELQDSGPGRYLRELYTAGRAAAARDQLADGEPVVFGPVTVTRHGVSYQDETVPWPQVADVSELPAAIVVVRGGGAGPVNIPVGQVPEPMVLARLLRQLSARPGTSDGLPDTDGDAVEVPAGPDQAVHNRTGRRRRLAVPLIAAAAIVLICVVVGVYRLILPNVFVQSHGSLPQYASDLAPACAKAGTAYPSASRLQGTGPHPIEVVVSENGGWTALGGLHTSSQPSPSATDATGATTQTDPTVDWDFLAPADVQLVACTQQLRGTEVVRRCSYTTPFTEVLAMKATTYRITVYELRTHRKVTTLTMPGADECPSSTTIVFRGNQVQSDLYAPLIPSQTRTRLARLIDQGTP
jgi:hypothetical protein